MKYELVNHQIILLLTLKSKQSQSLLIPGLIKTAIWKTM